MSKYWNYGWINQRHIQVERLSASHRGKLYLFCHHWIAEQIFGWICQYNKQIQKLQIHGEIRELFYFQRVPRHVKFQLISCRYGKGAFFNPIIGRDNANIIKVAAK